MFHLVAKDESRDSCDELNYEYKTQKNGILKRKDRSRGQRVKVSITPSVKSLF